MDRPAAASDLTPPTENRPRSDTTARTKPQLPLLHCVTGYCSVVAMCEELPVSGAIQTRRGGSRLQTESDGTVPCGPWLAPTPGQMTFRSPRSPDCLQPGDVHNGGRECPAAPAAERGQLCHEHNAHSRCHRLTADRGFLASCPTGFRVIYSCLLAYIIAHHL